MKLPDFLAELNQGEEKVFRDNAQNMTDTLFYAKLPLKLKRLTLKTQVNMAQFQNGLYDEVAAHFERELEINAELEESDDLPIPTLTSSTSKFKTPLSNAMGYSPVSSAFIERKRFTWSKIARNSKRKWRRMPRKANQLEKTFPKCGTSGKTHHFEKQC